VDSPPCAQALIGWAGSGDSDVQRHRIRDRRRQGPDCGSIGTFFIRHRLQVRVIAVGESNDGIQRLALAIHLWNRGEFPQTDLQVKVTINEIRPPTTQPDSVTPVQIGLRYTGVDPRKAPLNRSTFTKPERDKPGVTEVGAGQGFIGPMEVPLRHGQRCAFLLAESASDSDKVRIHGSVVEGAHNHPIWNNFIRIGQDFEFGVIINARDQEKKKWVHITRHYVIKFVAWDRPIVGSEWHDRWQKVGTGYPRPASRPHDWWTRRNLEPGLGPYPGE
jgi:hypothetical protein